MSCGWSWSWQCDVVQTCAASQVFMYRMRVVPPPLRVTLPPPSITILGPVLFTILAGRVRVIVTGSGPQLKVMTPPLATPATTASPVQLAAVPLPMTVRGCDVSSVPASAGTAQLPGGLPAAGKWSSLWTAGHSAPATANSHMDRFAIHRCMAFLRIEARTLAWKVARTGCELQYLVTRLCCPIEVMQGGVWRQGTVRFKLAIHESLPRLCPVFRPAQ